MDTLQSANTQQGDYKGLTPVRCDENELIPTHKFQNRQSPSPLHDRYLEMSPLRRISPSIVSTPIRTNGLEDIREEENEDDRVQSMHNPPPGSNFTFLPTHTTPPPRQTIRNPFDAALIKRLHLPIYSPTVFKKVVSPSQDMLQFNWTIDDVAKIQPAPIEEFNFQQCEPIDLETELKAQEAIDHYFCNTHIASSPWGPQPVNEISPLSMGTQDRQTPSLSGSDDGQDAISVDYSGSTASAKKEVSVQTMLSLPPQLPSALEAALKPYFLVGQEQNDGGEEVNLSTSTLRRKLFDRDEDNQNMSLSPVKSYSPVPVDCKVNSPTCSGLLFTSSRVLCPSSPIIQERTYGTPLPGSKYVSSPEISPIGTDQHRNKSVTRLNFSTRLLILEKSSRSPSASPLGLIPIEHEDDAVQEAAESVQEKKSTSLLGCSSAMISSEASTPVKGEAESECSTSAMITSEITTPIKEKNMSFVDDISMERNHFNKIADKLKEFGNSNNFTVEDNISSMNSFCLHSIGEMGGVNLHSQDTGYQTESISCNMTSIHGAPSSAFASVSSVSRNWSNIQFKSLSEKHINEGFHGEKCNLPVKGCSIMIEDNSIWLPNSKHIISSTPTKSSN